VGNIRKFSSSAHSIGFLALIFTFTSVFIFTFTLLVAPVVTAADLNLRSETLLRALERDTTKGEDRFVLPIYEYLSLDYQDLEAGGLSVHLYGWGRTDPRQTLPSAFWEKPTKH
jgi:hypothetical protein